MPLVLLTGAAGFVGKQIVEHLTLANVRLRLVLKPDQVALFDGLDMIESIVETDDLFIEPLSFMKKISSGVDLVIHAAWYVDPLNYLDSDSNIACLSGSLKLAEGCIANGIKRFIGIGTCFEYDLKEERLSIETPLNPATLYASSKVGLFFSLRALFELHRVEFLWCRLFYLFGDGEHPSRLVPAIRKSILAGKTIELTDGLQVRDYLDVRIAGQTIVNLALGDRCGPVNICSGKGIKIKDLALTVASEMNGEHLLKFGAKAKREDDPLIIIGVP